MLVLVATMTAAIGRLASAGRLTDRMISDGPAACRMNRA